MYLKLDESKWYKHTHEWSDWLEGIGRVDVYKGQIEVVEDVAPVVHAHWVDTWSHSIFECSACDNEFDDRLVLLVRQNDFPNYCPNCGAKMDLKEEG